MDNDASLTIFWYGANEIISVREQTSEADIEHAYEFAYANGSVNLVADSLKFRLLSCDHVRPAI